LPFNHTGYESNQKWFTEMVDACMATSGVTCGILSASDEWKYTLGKFCNTLVARVGTYPDSLYPTSYIA
jgi:hypothetical protein